MTRLLPLVALLMVAAPAAATSVAWVATKAPDGADVRKGSFVIGDAQCGYESMVDPIEMVRILEHLEKAEVHAFDGEHQDITLSERFFLVGLVESRYDRQMNGENRLEWQLTSGRQKRHDGFWQVTPTEGGGAVVTFENLIEAKSRLHQPLLRRIQNRTMDDISDAIRERCK
jgi:hypothetical protein